ncbi:MAG TPA: group 1 truncated hemoglobin [Dehalococcoidia bacterium]|nr:group 1 truncated hemoglobin [Dehalococcoidia bacterium]
MRHDTSIYDAIGGQPAVLAAVEEFYRRVLADPALAPFFAEIPMQRLKGHQAAFFAMALGGPDRYKGRSMREAHAGRDIIDSDFDRVAQHLTDTLESLEVDQETIGQIIGHVALLRSEVVDAETEEPAA